ncbi:MAG TPA: TolC family protein [Gemmatimonadaceae bacterium]|nr:TolC family protein [Gemmatimonadaceae bacterium]
MTIAPLARLGAAILVFAAPLALGAQDSTGTGQTVVLSLGDAVRLAARQAPAAEAGRFRADEARARVTQRRADLLPNVSALAQRSGRTFNTATFGIPFPGFNPNGQVLGPVILTDLRARASLNLVDLAALARVRAARTAATAGTLDAEAAAEAAASQAAAAYLRALRADAQLRARAQDSTLAAELLGIARSQLQAGTGTALDVTRAESQAAGVRAQLIAARSERSRTRLELLRALGLPLESNLRLSDSLERLAVTDTVPEAEAATSRALANRPDLRAADEQLRAARLATRAIQAERLPSLGAFGDQGAIGPKNDHLLNTYDWGIQISLPIFDGLRREGRIEEQRAVTNEADVRRRDLRAQTGVEVRSALLDIGAAREQVDAARERLRLAEQEVSQARERFTAGVGGNADVVTASLGLTAARNQLLDALTLYQSARVSLARAEGTATSIR